MTVFAPTVWGEITVGVSSCGSGRSAFSPTERDANIARIGVSAAAYLSIKLGPRDKITSEEASASSPFDRPAGCQSLAQDLPISTT
jgi:hypothetical protein